MKTGFIPSAPEIGRETLIVILGAVAAAIVLSQFPTVRAFIQKNVNGCDCDKH